MKKSNISQINVIPSNPVYAYTKMYHYMVDSHKIPRYLKPTFSMLLRYQGQDGYCCISSKMLAEYLGVSVQTVLNHIRILKEAGMLEVVCQNKYYLKTDFMSWVTEEMLADESLPYKAYYDKITASSDSEESCTEKKFGANRSQIHKVSPTA